VVRFNAPTYAKDNGLVDSQNEMVKNPVYGLDSLKMSTPQYGQTVSDTQTALLHARCVRHTQYPGCGRRRPGGTRRCCEAAPHAHNVSSRPPSDEQPVVRFNAPTYAKDNHLVDSQNERLKNPVYGLDSLKMSTPQYGQTTPTTRTTLLHTRCVRHTQYRAAVVGVPMGRGAAARQRPTRTTRYNTSPVGQTPPIVEQQKRRHDCAASSGEDVLRTTARVPRRRHARRCLRDPAAPAGWHRGQSWPAPDRTGQSTRSDASTQS
jgi:hypothetical protein